MNPRKCISKTLILLVMGLVLLNQAAQAGIIDIRPFEQTINPGDQTKVDLVYSDADSLVSGFDFLLNFDSAILSVASVDFGFQLGAPFASFQSYDLITAGQLKLSEFSLLIDFLGFQDAAGDLFLASVTFDSLSIGSSELSLESNPFGAPLADELAHPIVLSSLGTSAINVVAARVPEAPLSALLVIAAAGLFASRRCAPV